MSTTRAWSQPRNVGSCRLHTIFFSAPAQISPTTLFLIQGSGQTYYGAMNWGDGFITDRPLITATGMSDPNPFFLELLTKPYLNNVVISPHYYPPTISHATSQCVIQISLPPSRNSCKKPPCQSTQEQTHHALQIAAHAVEGLHPSYAAARELHKLSFAGIQSGFHRCFLASPCAATLGV